MDVKRIPAGAVGQAVDSTSQPSNQEHKQGDKSKKNLKKPALEPVETKTETPSAEWVDAELSHQPTNSESVVDLLQQPTPPPANAKPVYKTKKATTAAPSKLNQKY